MAQVGTAEEQIESRAGGGNAGTGESWETRVYHVYFDNNLANSIDARNATGVPAWGAALVAYPTAGYALLAMEKSARPVPGSQAIWEVTVTYRLPTATDNVPYNGTNNKWQVLVSGSPYPTEVPIQKDRDGKIITNLLGESLIEPQPTRVIYDEQINIRFLSQFLDTANINACKGSINGDIITILVGNSAHNYGAGTLLFNGWPYQEQYDEDGNKIVSNEYQLLVRAEGWNPIRFESTSVNELATGGVLFAGGTNNQSITLHNGDTDPTPHPLNSSGHRAQAGDLIYVGTYNHYQTANFSQLLLGIS